MTEKNHQQLTKSINAAKSFKELLDNGPLMTILSVQMIAIIILVYVVIKQSNEKSVIQAQLYQQMIERTDAMIDLKVKEKVAPVMEDAKDAVDKLNSTRESIDTASEQLQNILKNNNRRK